MDDPRKMVRVISDETLRDHYLTGIADGCPIGNASAHSTGMFADDACPARHACLHNGPQRLRMTPVQHGNRAFTTVHSGRGSFERIAPMGSAPRFVRSTASCSARTRQPAGHDEAPRARTLILLLPISLAILRIVRPRRESWRMMSAVSADHPPGRELEPRAWLRARAF